MKLYLIRHGKTVDDANGKQQYADAVLDPAYFALIDNLRTKLDGIKFDHVFTSPLPRAKATAEKLFPDAEELPYIYEYVRPQVIDGVEKSLAIKFWEQDHKQDKYLPDWSFDQGESFNTIVGRAQQLIEYLASLPTDNTVAIVGHGVFFRHLIGKLLMGETYTPVVFFDLLFKFDLRNCGYIQLELKDGSAKVLGIYND